MDYFRSAIADARLRYRVSRVVGEGVHSATETSHGQCVQLADDQPEAVLGELGDYLSHPKSVEAYNALQLLENLVSSCSHSFHLALAQNLYVQEEILQLAVRRAESEPQRQTQRLARLTLLEYSRMFVDDLELVRLAELADVFERRTKKNLMRSLNVQQRKVQITDPRPQDVISISGAEVAVGEGKPAVAQADGDSRSDDTDVRPWLCHVCTHTNSPSSTLCAACETVRLDMKEMLSSECHTDLPGCSDVTDSKVHTRGACGTSDPPPSTTANGICDSVAADASVSSPSGCETSDCLAGSVSIPVGRDSPGSSAGLSECVLKKELVGDEH